MQIQSLGLEDPLGESTAPYSSILAWRTLDRGAWQAIVHGVTRESDTNEATEHTHTHTHTHTHMYIINSKSISEASYKPVF